MENQRKTFEILKKTMHNRAKTVEANEYEKIMNSTSRTFMKDTWNSMEIYWKTFKLNKCSGSKQYVIFPKAKFLKKMAKSWIAS